MFHGFFQFPSNVQVFIFLFVLLYRQPGQQNQEFGEFSFSCWLLLSLVILLRLGDPFVFQYPIGVCTSLSPEQIPGWANSICLYGQISVSCTVPSGLPFPPAQIYSHTLSMLFCCIRLSCDWPLLLLLLLLESFSLQYQQTVSRWSLSVSKPIQVSRTLLIILADLNNALIWTASARPLISNSSIPFINLLVTVSRAPITIGINVTVMFQFLQFPSMFDVFILLFSFFRFDYVVSRDNKFHNFARSIFCFCCWLIYGLVVCLGIII